jgi:TldD protein
VIDPELAQRVIEEALRRGGDFAELFAEERLATSVGVDDGRVEGLLDYASRGVGIRVVVGETTGFAHTQDLSPASLLDAARVASSIARSVGAGNVADVSGPGLGTGGAVMEPGRKRKMVELARALDDEARSGADTGAIAQVATQVATEHRSILVANSEGRFVGDARARTKAVVHVVATGDGGAQSGREVLALSVDLDTFLADSEPLETARRARTRALVKVQAKDAPAGIWPVVLARGSGGILFHEACGHGLEADHIAKGVSVFAGRLGERLASPLVTLVDDPTMAGAWGAYALDDEGNSARPTVLIRDGVLVDYLWDRRSARKLGAEHHGNGRRQDYRSLPMVRMTNTFVAPGESDPEEIVAQTDRGIYVAALSGGQVNTATGDFVFGTQEAYLIEHGRISAPLRDTQLIGNGPAVLAAIDAVGNDLALSSGTCGKLGQGVPVGTGQPTLRVAAMTLGGTRRG